MPCILLDPYRNLAPGAYAYKNTVGIIRFFPPHPEIDTQASRVSKFRTANHLPRSSIADCKYDIIVQTCQRLKCNRAWCVDSDNPVQISNTVGVAGCATCGGPK